MKTACDTFADDLSALIDGELPAARRAEVEAHVAGCVNCRRRVEELQRLVEGVAGLPKVQPASQFLAAVRRKIATGDAPREWTWVDVFFRPFWLKLPLEALAAVMIVMSVWIHDHNVPYVAEDRRNRLAKNKIVSESPAETAPALPASTIVTGNEAPAKPADNRRDADENHPQALAPLPTAAVPPTMVDGGATRHAEVAQAAEKQLTRTESLPVGGDNVNFEQPKLAPAQRMIISNDAEFLIPKTPVETIVAESDDVEALRRRLDELAVSLNGFAARSSSNEVGAQIFYVVLPAENVVSFRARFVEAGKLAVEDKLSLSGQATTGVLSNIAVIEIRIVPAKP